MRDIVQLAINVKLPLESIEQVTRPGQIYFGEEVNATVSIFIRAQWPSIINVNNASSDERTRARCGHEGHVSSWTLAYTGREMGAYHKIITARS